VATDAPLAVPEHEAGSNEGEGQGEGRSGEGPDQDAEQRWRCLFGEFRLPAVRTPYLLLASQFDTYQLDHDLGGCGHWSCDPAGPAQLGFAWRFANATADFAQQLAVGELNPLRRERLIYSSRCHRHAASLNDADFLMPGCGGLSVEQALLAFLEEPQTLPRAWVDSSCDGFDCCCRPPDSRAIRAVAAASSLLLLCCGCCCGLHLRTRARRRRCRQRVARVRAHWRRWRQGLGSGRGAWPRGAWSSPQHGRADLEVTLVDAWDTDSAAPQPGTGAGADADADELVTGLGVGAACEATAAHSELPVKTLRATTLSPVPE